MSNANQSAAAARLPHEDHWVRLAGDPVTFDNERLALDARRAAGTLPGKFDEHLSSLQIKQSAAGRLGFKIVRSRDGWSLRYASGTMNFGLIQTAKTYAEILAVAKAQVSIDPTKRDVIISKTDLARAA